MSIKKLALAGGVAATLMAGTAYASVIDRPFFQVLGVVVVWGADSGSATTTPVVKDFLLLTNSGAAGNDLIANNDLVNTVVTGSLNPVSGAVAGGTFVDTAGAGTGVLDASDTLTEFTIDANTDVSGGSNSVSTSFFVASNTAFDVFAQADSLNATGGFSTTGPNAVDYDDISVAMALDTATGTFNGVAYGSAATGTVGTVEGIAAADNATLATIRAATGANGLKVFDGTARTATAVGSLAAQSVRFNNTYEFGRANGFDLSLGTGTVSAEVTYTVFAP